MPITLEDQIQIGGSIEYRGSYAEGVGIKILKGAPQPALEVETVLHELLHGVFLNQQLHIDPDVKGHEEKIVANLALGLTTVLKDNPQLVSYIQKALK